ncbi:uncharacterized protein [Hemitrygon akajei]|uniref:uncharacterized protein isoform X1 n=1 Tax=Hemitrygon akajei TaxID=2704970 RepID=UPI003BFA35B3
MISVWLMFRNFLQNGVLTEEVKNGKENDVDIRDACSSAVTVDSGVNFSYSERDYVSKPITMETKLTEKAIDPQGGLNVNATHECAVLKDIKETFNSCKLIAESTSTKHDENCIDNSENINHDLQGEVLKIEKVFDHAIQFETRPASYEMSKVICGTTHKEYFKDYPATVLVARTAGTLAQKDLEVTGQILAKKPHSVAAVPIEVSQEKMVENFQTRNEAGKVMAMVASAKSKKESTSNQSVLTSNGVTSENSSKMSQSEEKPSNFSSTDLTKLTEESPNILGMPRDNKGSINLSVMDQSGKIPYSGSNSNQTPCNRLIYQQESKNLSTTIQNEPLPITTPPGPYAEELGSDQTNKFKCLQKHSETNQPNCKFIKEYGSAEGLTSLNRKLVLEIMELQHQRQGNNPGQSDEVQFKPWGIKTQSFKPFQGVKLKTEVSESQSVDMEHMDFATARKQWLRLEAMSRTHSYGPAVKEQKNKMITKHVNKEKKDDSSINKSIENEVASPFSGPLLSEDYMQSKGSTGIKTLTDECMRNSTDLNKEQDVVASQEKNGTTGAIDQNLLLNTTACSPCPEGNDSGLDDRTHRLQGNNLLDPIVQNESSHSLPTMSEKPETPIEKEFCLSLKHEESLRKARGIITLPCSEKYTKIKTRPLSLLPVSPPSSPKVKNNHFAEMQIQREMLLEQQREEDLIQQGKILGKYNKSMIPEIEGKRKFFDQQNSFPFSLPNKMLAQSITSPATLLVSPPIRSPFSNETKVSNVLILQNDLLASEKDKADVKDSVLNLNYSNAETTDVVILQTPNLTVQRSSCLPLSSNSSVQREDTLQNNPFFKLRSHGADSIISQEIKEVLQREDELHKQSISVPC